MTKDTSAASKNLTIKYRWKPKSVYQLTIEDGAFTTIYGDKNKRQYKKFTIGKPENFSNLTLSVSVPDTGKMYVVQLLNEQGIVLRNDVITKKTKLLYTNYYVGKFTIRVVYDDNKNGKWDSGSIKESRQPENIWVNTKVITLRPNWDSEETIDIPKEVIVH